ncbi:hypothetical protein THRCLA_06852 [Thraustotheca clavata]|uniref:Splicing factor Cactin n=1 Tax=Thraustotheca clavata TaxID=74557 RepID=A0A1V9ZIY3_9STRA|nr:hypothetical protein THRCLA_06852 [Thraustotheca clavata]
MSKSEKKRKHRKSIDSSEDERSARKKDKKASKIAKAMGYSNDSNPFGDSNLTSKFVWHKKAEVAPQRSREKEIRRSRSRDRPRSRDRSKERRERRKPKDNEDVREELIREIMKVRQRRDERDAEREELERLKNEESRLRDVSEYEDWQQKEEQFHLSQARVRSHIRIREGREKPIDLLAKNLLLASSSHVIDPTKAAEDALAELKHAQVELRPPEQLLVGLKSNELTELHNDIQVYIELEGEKGENAEFWRLLEVICLDEMQKRDKKNSSRHAIHQEVQNSIKEMLAGKSSEELSELAADIEATIDGGGSGIDVEYYESVLQEIKVHKAKARLLVIHQKFLDALADRVTKQTEEAAYQSSQNKTSTVPTTTTVPKDSFDNSREALSMVAYEKEKGMDDEEEEFTEEVACKMPIWSSKYQPRKPRFFNRVKTGYDWNKYNQTHYDEDNPPPKIVQGYKFNLFYPDLIDKTITPKYSFEAADSPEFCIIRFQAGPPYLDLAFKIRGKSAIAKESVYVASLAEITGRIARQSFQSEDASWNDLEKTLREASGRNLRSILSRVPWCSRSLMHTGVTQAISNSLVDMALESNNDQVFCTLSNTIFDQLIVPCQDGSSLLARSCKWRKVPKYMEMVCPKKWEAITPSLKRLIQSDPERFAKYIRGVNFSPMFEARAQCAIVAMESLFEIYQEMLDNCSCTSVLHRIACGILAIDWNQQRHAAYRDDLLCRLFRFLQMLTFSASSSYVQDIFECLQNAIVENIKFPHEGVVLFTKLISLLSKDTILTISSDCFDRCMDAIDLFEAKPYLYFLVGLCAHTRLIPQDTVAQLLVCLLANEPLLTKALRYQAAYYIGIHRHFDFRCESQLQAMLLEDKHVHAHIPEELVVTFFSTCFKMKHRDIDLWLNTNEIESAAIINWSNRIPFCRIQLHTRAIEICKLEDEIPCLLTDQAAKRQRTACTSVVSLEECLDADVLQYIISYLSPKRLARLALVSRAFHRITLDPYLWQRMYFAPKAFLSPIVCLHPPTFAHNYRALFIQRYKSERGFRRLIRLNPAKKKEFACYPRHEDYSDDEEHVPKSSSRESKSRIGARVLTANVGPRVSVRDQIGELSGRCNKHTDLLRELDETQHTDREAFKKMVEQLAKRMEAEFALIRAEHEKKLKAANDEIDRLNKCLNVQRGQVMTLEEQCQSLHRHVVQVEDDVQILATEVLGE